MNQTAKVPKLKPFEAYGGMPDAEIVQRGTAVQTGMTGNPHFTTPPIDPGLLKTDIEYFSGLVAEALDGSKKVIAQKKKTREAVIKTLRMLGRYVEIQSDGDLAIFTSSGFQPISTTKAPAAPLPLPVIKWLDHGELNGQIVVQVQAIRKAVTYEIRYGVQVNGTQPSSWTSKVVVKVKSPIVIEGLTPGTIYAVQVRALGRVGHTEWTDSATLMCT